MNEMQRQAIRMITGMLTVGVLLTAISWNPLPLIVLAAVSYAVWKVARRFL